MNEEIDSQIRLLEGMLESASADTPFYSEWCKVLDSLKRLKVIDECESLPGKALYPSRYSDVVMWAIGNADRVRILIKTENNEKKTD